MAKKKYARTINDSTRGGARPNVIACFFLIRGKVKRSRGCQSEKDSYPLSGITENVQNRESGSRLVNCTRSINRFVSFRF